MKLSDAKYNYLYTVYNSQRFHTSTGEEEARQVKQLVTETNSKTILDYGSGKGLQYSRDRMHEKMGIEFDDITCYDIGVKEFRNLPDKMFDGVICIDVLEHIPETYLENNIKTIFLKAEKFVFLVVHCGLARKILSNGENAHCTIYPPEWWQDKIDACNTTGIKTVVNFRVPI